MVNVMFGGIGTGTVTGGIVGNAGKEVVVVETLETLEAFIDAFTGPKVVVGATVDDVVKEEVVDEVEDVKDELGAAVVVD